MLKPYPATKYRVHALLFSHFLLIFCPAPAPPFVCMCTILPLSCHPAILFQVLNVTSKIIPFLVFPSPVLSSLLSVLFLSLAFSLFLSEPCGLSPLFAKYSLTKKKWDFLLIEDQSGKVSSSKPAPSISGP